MASPAVTRAVRQAASRAAPWMACGGEFRGIQDHGAVAEAAVAMRPHQGTSEAAVALALAQQRPCRRRGAC